MSCTVLCRLRKGNVFLLASGFDGSDSSYDKFHPDRQSKHANENVFLGQVKCDIFGQVIFMIIWTLWVFGFEARL